MENTVEKIAEIATKALLPFSEALETSDEDIGSFSEELGFILPAVPPALSDLRGAAASMVETLTSFEEKVLAFEEEQIEEAELLESAGLLLLAAANFIGELATLPGNLRAQLPPAYVNTTHIDEEFLKRLYSKMLSDRLEEEVPLAYELLQFFGIIEQDWKEEDETLHQPSFVYTQIRWDRLSRVITNPVELFREVYQWGTPDFEYTKFCERIVQLTTAFGMPAVIDYPSQELLNLLDPSASADEEEGVDPQLMFPLIRTENLTVNMVIYLLPQASASDPRSLALSLKAAGRLESTINLAPRLNLTLEGNLDLSTGLGLAIHPLNGFRVVSNLELDGLAAVVEKGTTALALAYGDGAAPMNLLAFPGLGRVSLEELVLKGGIGVNPKLNQIGILLEAALKGGKIIISGEGGDGFLSTILPSDGIELAFDIAVGFNSATGFYFKGSSTLEVEIPSHISVGPIQIRNLYIRVPISTTSNAIPLEFSTIISAELGAFTAVVERFGIKVDLRFPEQGGDWGPLDLDFAFKPPTGIGLSLETPTVKGGGYLFFDPENERYGGALELSIQNTLVVTAVGLITTRLPDGSKGFSMLVIVSVQFFPGIALGMGFFLSGLGGLIGISRTIQVEALREGVRQGSLDHILFPENVVQNITRIISDLRAIFPPKRDQFIIGLMAKISWSVPPLLSIEFGIAIEFASPVRIGILGVLKAVIPTEEAAILRLQVSFMGMIDFEKGELSFDASLEGSRLLTFTLEGDMALRLSWGEEKGFLLSVGGFHPSFEPPARYDVRVMKRITLNILSDNPRLVLTTYFAITSNTVQFGAAIDFSIRVSEFSVVGYFGFDVLFQFSPFRFIANIRAGIQVKMGSTTLFAITLEFELQGPTPWIAKGTASFKILFFSIKVHFNKTWGEEQQALQPKIAALPKLLEALEKESNWLGELPANRFLLVSLRETQLAEGEVLLQSAGSLSIRQTVLPLDLQVDRWGNNLLQDIRKASISRVAIEEESVETESVRDAFAPASYKEMADVDKLKSPSYVQEKSGVRVKATDAIRVEYALGRVVEYEVRSSDHHAGEDIPYELFEPLRLGRFRDSRQLFNRHAKAGAVGRSALSREAQQKRSGKSGISVGVAENAFTIVSNADLSRFSANGFSSGSKAQADDALQQLLKQQPKLKDLLQVVPEYELQEV